MIVIKASFEFELEIESELMAGKRVGILCRTKNNARMYSEMFKSYQQIVFSADTRDMSFEDINSSLHGKQLVIMTSAVTVGADIQEPFDKVFIDFRGTRGHSCTARNVLQMTGRFRRLSCPCLCVLVSHDPELIPGLEESVKQYILSRRNLVDENCLALTGGDWNTTRLKRRVCWHQTGLPNY